MIKFVYYIHDRQCVSLSGGVDSLLIPWSFIVTLHQVNTCYIIDMQVFDKNKNNNFMIGKSAYIIWYQLWVGKLGVKLKRFVSVKALYLLFKLIF